jgi:hypothetical protein
MSMERNHTVYYWIMALACILPAMVLLGLSDGLETSRSFFLLLALSPVGFTAGVLLMNWKKGKAERLCKGEHER